MVKEVRFIFSPKDVKQMRVVCSTCKGEIVRPVLIASFHLPKSCPQCNTEWWDDRFAENDPIIQQTKALLDIMNYLIRNPAKDTPPFTVRFEIDGEDEEKP